MAAQFCSVHLLLCFFSSHQVGAGDARCQQHCPQGRSGGGGTIKSLFVGVGDDVQGSCEGLLARGLDLILRELEAERPVVPELEGVGEGDPLLTSPVP